MMLPIVQPAPVVLQYGDDYRSVFKDCRQFNHFRNYVTGLMVLENKSMANMARCLLESSDKSNISRFFSESPWEAEGVNDKRVAAMVKATQGYRIGRDLSALIVDDTLCEHVGSLFEYVARHYHHGEDRYPLAHNLVTSHYVSGVVRFPVDLRIYRRYEEQTEWEAYVKKHFPERPIPTNKKERQRFHKEVDPILLQDAEFKQLDEQFQTKIALAIQLIHRAIERELPFEIVLFDSWYLAEEIILVLQHYGKDWISLLKKNRKVETNSFVLKDATGQVISFQSAHIKVEELVPLIPANAYRRVDVHGKSYWCFSRNLSIPGLGKVRLVVSFDNPDLKGDYALLLSNRLDWSAERIIETYLLRWPIETFYQDGKGHLGLDEYRMRTAEAFQKHWCLVFVAYSFLHLDCLHSSLPSRSRLPNQSIGEACRQQARALLESLLLFVHDLLDAGQTIDHVFQLLFAKQSHPLFA